MRWATVATVAIIGALLGAGSPAAAQWTRVTQLPARDVISLTAHRDTILAGTDTCVFVSTDAGASWRASSRVTPDLPFVVAALVRNGVLYAGTASQGVFVSPDLGTTWTAFNQGLVGGILDSQLDISDLVARGDSLYASTFGAGVYVRPLVQGGTWHPYGNAFEPNQAPNVNAMAVGGPRLLAAAGGNGTVFERDPADPEWTVSFLDNVGLEPGLQAQSLIWNGNGWVVGTVAGVFRSATGLEPWTLANPGVGTIHVSTFAARGRQLFAAFDITGGVVIKTSDDDGASWDELDRFPLKFIYKLAVSRSDLFAARADGLFRSTNVLSVPGDGPSAGLRFGLVGAQPVGDQMRFRIDTPEAGEASIELFDVTGRRAAATMRVFEPVGSHEVTMDARGLAPGVYASRLTVGSRHQTLRLVHVR